MKIPGLDEAMTKLDKFDEMQPVLEEIRDSLNTLVDLQAQMLDMTAEKWHMSHYGSR
jgi:uncharacterized protein YktB (UPF0637 family)